MGYDTDRFVTEINEALTCCICRDVLEDPVQAPCEHAYCRTCIEGWLVQETTCPEDRRPLSVSTLRPLFRYMRNDLNRLRIHCKNQAYGCEIVLELEFIEPHQRGCQYERLKCPHERCVFYGSRDEVNEHKTRCRYGRRECPRGCGLLISMIEDENHSCMQELRTSMEVLRSEMCCKFEDQKRELQLRLDMQRSHMIQKEATLQSQIDALKSENSKLTQNVELLMDMELTRRQHIEKLELEKQELVELLRDNIQSRSAAGSDVSVERQSGRSQRIRGKVTTLLLSGRRHLTRRQHIEKLELEKQELVERLRDNIQSRSRRDLTFRSRDRAVEVNESGEKYNFVNTLEY